MAGVSSAASILTPVGFVAKWRQNTQSEKQIAQSHFVDLCRLLGHPTPAEDDPSGDYFAFEKRATKIGGGKGFADVWKKNYFAWEYKSRGENLDQAHKQLMTYAPALRSPPIQVVCDFERYRIHTAWTNTVPATHEILLDDFVKPDRLQLLRNVFHDPEKLKPVLVRSALTKEAADKFATIALRMQGRGSPEEIAHFVNQLVFCYFANSVDLLPRGLWSKLLERAQKDPAGAKSRFDKLFEAMRRGEDYGAEPIVYFNGGLFDGQHALPLDDGDIGLLRAANSLDWGQIDPSIFGSLFERFLDPEKRAQIGAHYTDAEKIQKIIEPVILRPLLSEWEKVKGDITALLSKTKRPPFRGKSKQRMRPLEAAEERRAQYLKRLKEVKILDPACGSGNFLYLALQGVKDIEHRVNLDSELMGLKPQLPFIGPEILKGIEANPVAAELARTTIWIGDIQWRIRNGIHSEKRPVLEKLRSIERRDALISSDEFGRYKEAEWPIAEFIVGNPPFLGGKLMRGALGDDYFESLIETYRHRVKPESDLVTYWFEKCLQSMKIGTKSTGLVATQSVRRGANRAVLDKISDAGRIFEAWADEPWIVDGAAVRVSLICFDGQSSGPVRLDGRTVQKIHPDLSCGDVDLTKAIRLPENRGIAFQGTIKVGAFDVAANIARDWLRLPTNANGRKNADVVKPWANASDLAGRPSDTWIIDFGVDISEHDAAFYETPFHHILHKVKPFRDTVRRDNHRINWWRHGEARPGMRIAVAGLSRFLVTPRVSKHRFFSWLDRSVLPDSRLVVIARDDDATFGVLHSRFHEAWSLRLGGWHGVGNDPQYTPTQGFESFPFPLCVIRSWLTEKDADRMSIAISRAAKHLDDLRNAWLNPPELIEVVPEVVPGYPDRILPKNTVAAAELKKRTLTNLYNARPQWLDQAHRELDAAVAAAYGWPADISEEKALAKLLELNLASSRRNSVHWR